VFRVGLSGGIGSGKSTVADLFAAHGAAIIDADLIAHELTAPGGAAIAAVSEAFGASAIGADGALDRAWMRQLVFSHPEAKQRLEAILHPRIRARLEAKVAAAPEPVVIVVVPLLVESGEWQGRFDRVLVVDCPEQTQVERVMARSGLARSEVLAIIARQVTRTQRLAAADDVIFNDGAPEALGAQVERLYCSYLGAA
jgi:dephospho-CoA kinase